MIENKIQIRVRYAHIDKMGIVYHSRYLEWFEAARSELLRELGIAYSEIKKKGTTLPVVEAHLKYKVPAKYDDSINIVSIIKDIPSAKLKIFYKIYNEDFKNLLVEGYTIHAFINSKGKPTRIPLWIKKFLEKKINND